MPKRQPFPTDGYSPPYCLFSQNLSEISVTLSVQSRLSKNCDKNGQAVTYRTGVNVNEGKYGK